MKWNDAICEIQLDAVFYKLKTKMKHSSIWKEKNCSSFKKGFLYHSFYKRNLKIWNKFLKVQYESKLLVKIVIFLMVDMYLNLSLLDPFLERKISEDHGLFVTYNIIFYFAVHLLYILPFIQRGRSLKGLLVKTDSSWRGNFFRFNCTMWGSPIIIYSFKFCVKLT